MAEPLREIVFDTETTGISHKDGDRVVEIGAIELINRYPTGNTYHQFVNPEGREVHPDAFNVHGISNEFLSDKPVFSEVMEEFLAFFSTGSLVAHNADFDHGFLNAELARQKHPGIDPTRIVDTLQIARRKFPGQKNSLDALCNRFAIDNSRREKHGALLDSELLAEVYLELLGGKQASLTLEPVNRKQVSVSPTGNETITPVTRSVPLASRLSKEDIERHAELVETLGENAIWNKFGG